MSDLSRGKLILWGVLAVPAIAMLGRFALTPDAYAGALLAPSGEWSARFIILALMLTPLGRLFPDLAPVRWLLRHRRAIGVAAFLYALLHLAAYVIDMETLANMLAELGAPAIWTGWLALLVMVPPALTSTDRAMRALKAGWKRLQRLAYPAAVLTLVHWALVHDGATSALLHFAPLAVLQSWRLARRPPLQSAKETRMTLRILAAAAALGLTALCATPAVATGKMTCNAPQKNWKSVDALQAQLKKQGWQVRKAKVDGGCYEVYGTDPQGRRVEAYFHPVSLKLLLSSRRGEVLYRAR